MVYIGRKGSHDPRPVKAVLTALAMYLVSPAVRKQRPALAALFIPARAGVRSTFYKLPVIPSAVVNNPAALLLLGPAHEDMMNPAPVGQRWVDMMLPAPPDGGAANTPENVRGFIKNHLGPVVDAADLAVIRINA